MESQTQISPYPCRVCGGPTVGPPPKALAQGIPETSTFCQACFEGKSVPFVDTRPDRSKSYDPPKPILDRLLVRRLAQEEQTGFAIPEKYRQHSSLGEVIAIGDGIALAGQWFPMDQFVKVGDTVKYGEYCAERLGPDDENVFVIRLQDVRFVERLKSE